MHQIKNIIFSFTNLILKFFKFFIQIIKNSIFFMNNIKIGIPIQFQHKHEI